MKRFVPILLIALFAAVMFLPGLRRGAVSHAEFDAAVARANTEGKHVFLAFIGSDWCDWCVKFEHEIYHSPVFQEFAASNLVVVVVDFPRFAEDGKSEAQRKQDSSLADRFRVHGFPTFFLLNPDGKAVAKTGYQRGGPEAYIDHIEQLIADAKKEI